jgi:head-tail adaptor
MATRGQKRHLVTLENPGPSVPDGDGGYTQVWTALSPPRKRAEIKPATARDLERIAAGTVLSTASHVITMDYHRDVTTKTRVSWTSGGRTHAASVTGVMNPEERCIDLILVCEEVVA